MPGTSSNPNQSPNPRSRRPFLWEQNSVLSNLFDRELDASQLDACNQFAQALGAQRVLTSGERASLMAQLGLTPAKQDIISPVDFENLAYAIGSPTNFNNLTGALLAPINSALISIYSSSAMQRLEFADPVLWQALMSERAAYEITRQTSPHWMAVAYDVYLAASELIADNDPDFVQSGSRRFMLG